MKYPIWHDYEEPYEYPMWYDYEEPYDPIGSHIFIRDNHNTYKIA